MDQLIAQDVKPIGNETQHLGSVARLECMCEGAGRYFEAIFPIREAVDPIVMLPERIEDLAVFHEHPHKP